MVMTVFQLVTQAAVDTRNGVVGVEVDVDLGVTEGRVLVAFAGHNPVSDNLGRHLGDQVDGPTRVGLLGVVHEPEAAGIFRVPCLPGVRLLIFLTCDLEIVKYKISLFPTKITST